MKTLIILTISSILLFSCIGKDGGFFNPGERKNGEVSFIIDGQKYSSTLNWDVGLLNSNKHNAASELIIKDTLGFNFSHIMLLNHSGICGVVIPIEYKDPKYHPFYWRDENDSCFVFKSYVEEGLNHGIDTLAIFKIVNGSFETILTNCKTNCGKDLLSGLRTCSTYCDIEGTFSFEAKNGYDSSIFVSNGNYIAYSRYIGR